MGIIDCRPLGLAPQERVRAQQEADAIFVCVFLGFLGDGLRKGIRLRWDVDPADADADRGVEQLRATLDVFAALLGFPGAVEAGKSPAYFGGEDWHIAVAGAHAPHDRADFALAQAMGPRTPEVRARIEEVIRDDDLAAHHLDRERGAYYGIVDDPRNVNPMLISSVRRLIPPPAEGGRWNRGVRYHGLIGYDANGAAVDDYQALRNSPKQAGSVEPTELVSSWDGTGHVCGYCHGMVWAVGQAQVQFPGSYDGMDEAGVPYELGLGANTHKLASCFGCSTYLYANGIAPSSMHLGRSDSWVPLPDGADGVAPFAYSRDQEKRYAAAFARLNDRWSDAIAGWMRDGIGTATGAGRAVLADWVAVHATLLAEEIIRRPTTRAVANLFLDALTVHARDADRLRGALGRT